MSDHRAQGTTYSGMISSAAWGTTPTRSGTSNGIPTTIQSEPCLASCSFGAAPTRFARSDDDYAAVRALGEEYGSRVPRCLTSRDQALDGAAASC